MALRQTVGCSCHDLSASPQIVSEELKDFIVVHLLVNGQLAGVRGGLIHACAKEDKGAGFLGGNAGGLELGGEGGVLGAGVEDDAAGAEGNEGLGEVSGDGGADIHRDGINVACDRTEVGQDGVSLDLLEPRVDGDDMVAVLLQHQEGTVGVALGLVTGSEDDDSFWRADVHG